jgi:UDP-glucose 4-epimerase
MESYDHAYGLKFVALRYFNACGAAGELGEDHDPETHLIPNVLRAALGKIPYVSVFGNNYPTPDGTPVRDYIHVSDLADAHARALDYLRDGGKSERINLGNGHGYSVLEVIEAARQVTGKPIDVRIEPPRSGDPSKLVADAEYAHTLLGWRPAYPDLSSILESDWNWRVKHPDGYAAD